MTYIDDRSNDTVSDRDLAIESLLTRLDPEATRPRYWQSLQRSIVDAARLELARRRRLADLTVAGTVTSWARTVVPSAVVAAAAAAVILLVVPAPPNTPVADVGVEELLSIGLEDEAIPADLDDPTSGFTFAAAEIF